jgi:O-antigen/teichoic acid export membrane protein
MLKSLKTIVKNTVIIYSAEILSRFFLFVVVIYIARVFGVKLFGEYSYAMTVFLFLQTFSDFGFTVFLTREVAREPERRDEIFHAALYLRTGITALLLVIFVIYLRLFEVGRDIQMFVLITGISLILSSYALNFMLTMRGMNRMKTDASIRVTGIFIATLCTLIAIRAGFGISGVAYAIAIGNMSTLVIAFWVNRKEKLILKPDIRKFHYVDMVRKSMPFGIMAILSVIYTRIDTILIQHLKGAVEVGLFNAAFKIVDAVLIFPFAFSIVLIPVMSSLFGKQDMDSIKKLTRMGFKHMGYVGILIGILVYMLSDKIIEMLYFSAEYNDAVFSLKIFSAVIAVIFIANVAGPVILSSRVAHVNLWIIAVMVVLSVALNLIAIPKWGSEGAAGVRLTVEVFGLFMNMIVVNKLLFRINYFADILRPLVAGLAMIGFILIAKSLLFIPLYCLVYAFVLHILGGISAKEFEFAREIITEKFSKS